MNAFAPSKILVFGATGTIGHYITSSLLRATPPFNQLSIFTSQKTVQTKADVLNPWKERGMSVIVGDVTSEEDVAAAYRSTNADTIISCLGRGAIHTQIPLLRLAEASETVKWFIPSEYGTDIEHGPKSPSEKPHQQKLAVRKFIRESVKRMRTTYLVTGPYFDMWVNGLPGIEAAGGFDVSKKEATLIEDGEDRIGFCTMNDVGKSLVATLRHPEAAFGKALKVQSFVVTPRAILAEYERQTGSKWSVSYTPLEEVSELETRLWGEGNPKATPVTLRRIWAEGGTLYEKNDNESIGLKENDMDSLETGVRRALTGEGV